MQRKVAFLDTNYHLHFRAFVEVDWCALLDAVDVELVFPSITIEELDGAKNSARLEKLRDRARSVTRRLEELFSGEELSVEIRSGVRATLDHARPSLSDFQLDPDSQDSRVLAAALARRAADPSADIVIVSDDTGARLRAKQHKLVALRPPDSLRLPDALSEHDRTVQDLRAELARVKGAQPRLSLAFAGGASPQTMVYGPPQSFDLNESMNRVRDRHPRIAAPDVGAVFIAGTAEGYNGRLERYLVEYRKYLQELKGWSEWAATIEPLTLIVGNDGNSPGEDIDIVIEVGASLRVLFPSDRRKQPVAPKPPRRPSAHELLGLGYYGAPVDYDWGSYLSPAMQRLADIGPQPNLTGPYRVNAAANAAAFHVDKLKHGYQEELKLSLERTDVSAKVCAISYRLHAANLPDETTGDLTILLAESAT